MCSSSFIRESEKNVYITSSLSPKISEKETTAGGQNEVDETQSDDGVSLRRLIK